MGKRGGGGEGRGGKGGRVRFLPGWFSGAPSRCPITDDILRQVAEARGHKDADELLISIGKQDTGMSKREALDLMAEELGYSAAGYYALGLYYSNPGACEQLLESYTKHTTSRDPLGIASAELLQLKKFCGHRGDEEK